MSDLVGNPEDRFSRAAAHFIHKSISFRPIMSLTNNEKQT